MHFCNLLLDQPKQDATKSMSFGALSRFKEGVTYTLIASARRTPAAIDTALAIAVSMIHHQLRPTVQSIFSMRTFVHVFSLLSIRKGSDSRSNEDC
jgi:hypothetical protein